MANYPEHSHDPTFEINDSGCVVDVIASDPNEAEGEDHYYLHIAHNSEGVVLDVYDIHGEEVFATFALTYGELVAHVFAMDPSNKV